MEAGGTVRKFTDLIVWRKAIAFGRVVYHLSGTFPRDERFGLTSQIRRAVVSVASNIAEGHARQGREFRSYLSIAKGSTAEVESQLLFAAELGYITRTDVEAARELVAEIHKMTAKLLQKLSPSS
jgi:four helix bundle protein